MSIHFDFKNKQGKELLALNRQWNELSGYRAHAFNESVNMLNNVGETFGVNGANAMQTNMQRVDEMYRLVDSTGTGEDRDWGNQTLLGRLLSQAQTVSIGKKVIESRRYSEAGRINRSMSGQTDIDMDKTKSSYQKMVIPVFDGAYGRDFRDYEAMRSEMLPALAEDSEEIEFTLLDDVNDYLWNGDAKLKVDTAVWGGLKADASVAAYSLGADLTTATEAQVVAELLALLDVLRITNKKSGPFELYISPQIMSNWQKLAGANTNGFMNIMAAVRALIPEFSVVEADSALQGNQVLCSVVGTRGLHAKIGMMMSSYQVPRVMHNDPYQFVKWFAAGFQSNNSFSGLKSTVYGS
ncbi:putative coat protein [Pseudoalteromonas phage TW1]|uniref:Coat protein n=1 Tax=Pseudoalteromonas phage TW1 TaxID=1366055 RepID=A0ACD6B8P8_9CAUD|nr:virion structural protein [Pseudoalteromonas phage TW1]5WK1_A Chain A, Major Capsid Protein [Pseudoalteromonas phage TW1]5WK1_B Chain B, Major Capsid Protein [Pseudoalteromonas phage TW1]5WK1_C Chain C, Major Capsid Protein [Pseudoalteromonas phage TW1]5WK1_D Chain D, Major Capsid Protein [Pseudoalteromonas phage TW1]5WK1_E Chain E, Major Capsid Protein [Pseudoalteromonas phage TW1]5WK1_F Chain F, Major Capsid Protein [Pseudoalteromonas phage TW1]5WK1_G Chain G, Major Capsid Protein [Pseu